MQGALTRRGTVYKLAALVLLTLGLLLSYRNIALPQARAATGTICDQYGSTTQGNYVVMNNRWGTTATQCINVTTNGFQITRQDGVGNTSGAPVSYPAIYIGCHYSNCSPNSPLPRQISSISAANTSVNLTLTSSGTYNASYDIWLNPTSNVSGVQASEIMIWLHWQGSIQPIGSRVGTVSLAGRSWEVWSGSNGQNNVVSYRSQNITSFSADVMPFIRDSFTRHSSFGNSSWYLTSMQMGFEPWVGGVGLAVNSFSASITTGTTTQPTATRVPTQSTNPTATRTPTQGTGPTATRVPTSSTGGSTCSPATTIPAPFTKDGSGTFCWQASSIPSYINSWNLSRLTVNGVNFTNLYASASQLPPKINGYYYISYSGSYSYSHFELR